MKRNGQTSAENEVSKPCSQLDLPAGRYRHHKGNEYTILGVARHSETLEELVVYRQEYGERGLWVRPRAMFLENVRVDGREVPRFQRVEAVIAPASGNLLRDIPAAMPGEVLQTIVAAGNVRIERIVSHGQASPEGFWYEQDQEEWVLVLCGAARLEFEDGGAELGAGDYVYIAAGVRHRVAWTTPGEATIWLAVFYGDG